MQDGLPFNENEFVSLSASPLTARRDGWAVWRPAVGGLVPKPIPGAPVPSVSAPKRLRQMRALARDLRAFFNTPNDHSELRPLTQALYRYEADKPRPEILDGALIAFVLTTDPEVLLVLEARSGRAGAPADWNSGLAPMSIIDLRATHKDR